jgi:hypothetical protein
MGGEALPGASSLRVNFALPGLPRIQSVCAFVSIAKFIQYLAIACPLLTPQLEYCFETELKLHENAW